MRFMLYTILYGNLTVLLVYLFSYAIESVTGLNLLIWNLTQKSNEFMARGAANIAAIVYFLVNFAVWYLRIESLVAEPEGYSFGIWLSMILVLTVIFRMIHFKITPIDPNRSNFDFSD